MQNKRKQSLNKYLMQAASTDDVLSNHAYGRVARSHRPIPKRRLGSGGSIGAVSGYKDSMVGSIAQYRQNTFIKPKTDEATPKVDGPSSTDVHVMGNRPMSSSSEQPKTSASADDRYRHVINPPRRNFGSFG